MTRLERKGDTEEKPFWQLDEELGELELQERPGGPDRYAVRLKARTTTTPYHAKRELYPLQHDGSKHEVSGKVYILVPDITLTVGLFPREHPSSAIGGVIGSSWQGMRHHEIAAVRGLYYEEDVRHEVAPLTGSVKKKGGVLPFPRLVSESVPAPAGVTGNGGV